jgi:hypothetical protein
LKPINCGENSPYGPQAGFRDAHKTLDNFDFGFNNKVLYREAHTLIDELADASQDVAGKEHTEWLVSLPLLILDDLGMRKLALTAAEDLPLMPRAA